RQRHTRGHGVVCAAGLVRLSRLELAVNTEVGKVRIFGVKDDCSAHGALPIQRALRTPQHFHMIQVEISEWWGGLVIRDTKRCVVEVVADHSIADGSTGSRAPE